MDGYFDKLDGRWRLLPVQQQRRYTRNFFIGYVILTALVVIKVCVDTAGPRRKNDLKIEHIENPTLPKQKTAVPISLDSLSIILKK